MSVAVSAVMIGRILRPWGRNGAVVVEPWTHDARRFERIAAVDASGQDGEQRLVLASVRFDRCGRPIVSFAGVGSISQAEALRGARLSVAESDALRPAGPAWFHHELINLKVQTPAGEDLGRVLEILETGATPVLTVGRAAHTWLLPLAQEFLQSVDLAAGVMVVNLPPGLLEVNLRESERAD